MQPSPTVEPPTWTVLRRRRLSRRVLLRAGARAGVGATGLALVGCGGNDDGPGDQAESQAEDEQAQSQSQSAAGQPSEQADAQAAEADDPEAEREGEEGRADAEPAAGGILNIFGTTDSHDRFDPHRSRFRNTQAVLSLMYSRLLQPDSVGRGTLAPDLAGLPEMPDETTYVFELNPNAVFWAAPPTNGRAVTSEDVRLSIQRQIDGTNTGGDPDLRFFRQALMARTSAMETPDDATISLQTDEPDATYLSTVLAGPWSFVISAEAAEQLSQDWDLSVNDADITLSSGSGPFVANGFVGASMSLTRSENWWGATPALLDAIVFSRPGNPELASSYGNGALDAVDFPLPGETIEALADGSEDNVRYEFPVDTPVQLSFVVSDDPESPFNDPRVGTAIGLAVDRFALIDRLYAGDGRPSGPLPWYLEGWALPEEALLEHAGYRPNKHDDLTDIALLVDAAGGAENLGEVSLIVADLFEGFYPGVAQSVSGMVQQNAGLTLSTSFRSYAEITDRLRDGTLPSFFGWGPAPLQADPTDLWRRTAHSAGDENYGRYTNADVDALIDEMTSTFEMAARQQLAQQVQDLLLTTGYWQQNIANGIQLGIHKPYYQPDPRGHDFAWAGHHLAAGWIDVENEEYPEDRELPQLELPDLTPPRPGDEDAEENQAEAPDDDAGSEDSGG